MNWLVVDFTYLFNPRFKILLHKRHKTFQIVTSDFEFFRFNQHGHVTIWNINFIKHNYNKQKIIKVRQS